MCDILCSCPFLLSRRPLSLSLSLSPSLSPFCLVVCVIGGFGDFLPFVQFPLPSLWREKSGAQLS